MPRYAMLVVANNRTESGKPALELVAEMGKFNQELIAAGMMLSGEGFQPTGTDGYRVTFSASSPATVEKGPFDVTRQGTISGFWILTADNVDAVLEAAKKVPFKEGQVEIRRISSPEDFETS